MADTSGSSLHSKTPGGTLGSHPTSSNLPFAVAPSTSSEVNTLRLRLVPVACYKVEDIRFAFNSSFVTPEIATELAHLRDLREQHKNPKAAPPYPPLSVFGHADPVGDDDYNKQLSGRRAIVIYALLTVHSDPDKAAAMWKEVAKTESWSKDQVGVMKQTVPAGTPESEVVRAYMLQLCPSDLVLSDQDFLARGADSDGKGDYQGCSEFNPLLIFSENEQKTFDKAAQTGNKQGIADRNAANAPNRRVMVMLFRPGSRVDPAKWPCPTAKGDKAGCIKRFWSDHDNRRHMQLPGIERNFNDAEDTFACRFYQRLNTGSPCEQRVSIAPPTLEIVLDSSNHHRVDGSDPAATFVRIGIWDHAFDPVNGKLVNTADDQTNFIGNDSKGDTARRFYLRVTDGNASGLPEVRARWRTELGSGGIDDAPASEEITLTPTAADPAIFVSRALFLVTDIIDQAQPTNSGLDAKNADAGDRAKDSSNHRTRGTTINNDHPLDGRVVADYTSPVGGNPTLVRLPVFQREPEERLRLSAHFVNVRSSVGGAGCLNAARMQAGIDALRSVYGRCGIYVEVDDFELDPPASCIGWSTRYPASPLATNVDPAVESGGFKNKNEAPSASQSDIINRVRARSDFKPSDLYVVYINRLFSNPMPAPSPTAVLTQGPGGIAFPDAYSDAASIARSFVFVGVQTVNIWADVHEITHMTTDLRNSAGGHFHLQASVNAGPGTIDGRNLMQRFALINNNDTADSKRLWDEDFTNNNLSPPTIPAQISAIRKSRFVRPY